MKGKKVAVNLAGLLDVPDLNIGSDTSFSAWLLYDFPLSV